MKRDGNSGPKTAVGKKRLNFEPHLKDYLRILFVRRWILISVLFVVVSGMTAYVFVQTPIYRATATILIEPTNPNLTEIKAVYDPTMSGGDSSNRQTFMKTQYELIVCRPLLERTFHRFHFDKKPEFAKAGDPIPGFKKSFFVAPVRNTRLVNISFDWRDPELATKVVDFHVNEYLADYRKRRLGVSEGGLSALMKQAEDLKPMVEEKAQMLQRFKVENNMLSLDKTQDIVVERMKAINQTLHEVEKMRIQAEARYNEISSAVETEGSLETIPEIIESVTIRDLKLEYNRANQLLNDLGNRFGANHPEVLAAKASQASIITRMNHEVRQVLASAESEYTRAMKQEKELHGTLEEQEKKVMEFNEKSVEFNMLSEQYDAINTSYRIVTQRIENIKISIAAGSKEDNIFIISAPQVPTKPVKPRKQFSIILAIFVGLIIGGALCFFIEYLDTTIKTKDEVERLLDTPVMGYVPLVTESKGDKDRQRPIELMSMDKPNSVVAEAFRSIRSALTFSDSGKGLKSLLLTSSVPMEGKTLTSVNLAIALAKSNKRVLLVDADMRRPRLSRVLSPKSKHGLSSLLIHAKGITLESAVITSDMETLDILPCGPIPPNPAELLGSSRMKELLGEMCSRYDHVVFDTPPVISATDATVLSQYVQGSLLVIRAFTTQRELAIRARDTLASAHGNLVGTILNSVDVPRRVHYGGYGGYYYYYDKYSYGEPEADADTEGMEDKIQAEARRSEKLAKQDEKEREARKSAAMQKILESVSPEKEEKVTVKVRKIQHDQHEDTLPPEE